MYKELLDSIGLVAQTDPDVADAMAKDKKAGGGQVAFILLKRPGEVEIVPLDVARVCE